MHIYVYCIVCIPGPPTTGDIASVQTWRLTSHAWSGLWVLLYYYSTVSVLARRRNVRVEILRCGCCCCWWWWWCCGQAGGRRGRSLAVVELLRLDGYVSTLARGSEACHGCRGGGRLKRVGPGMYALACSRECVFCVFFYPRGARVIAVHPH